MRTSLIVEADVAVEDPTQAGFPDDEQVVEALLARRPDPPLGDRIRVGRAIGVRMIATPSLRKTASKARTNLLSRSWSR